MGNPLLHDVHQGSLDQAVALSLSLTSYVSSSRPLSRIFHCHRAKEPREVLDQLILAWQRNDRPWLEASLGPSAIAALDLLLQGKTWADMRAELWPGESGGSVAVGYRFDIPSHWSEPEETLQEERLYKDAGPIAVNADFDVDTLLKDSAGGDCGRHRVKFIEASGDDLGHQKYLVDNSDLFDLLRSLAACATGR